MSDKQVAISADSTCDLSEDVKKKYGVSYFPFFVRFREKEYKDNVDIHPSDLYEGYYEDGSLPSTAASSVGEFSEYFKKFLNDGFEVVHISLGSGLSSSFQNADIAAEDMDGVYVVDSKNLSSGSGLLVMQAAKLAEDGKSAKEIAELLNKMTDHVHSSFVLDTLEFMAAGGRCPAIASKAAGMLKCKPSIKVDNTDGTLHVSTIYRGKTEKVLKKYVEETLGNYDNILYDDIYITDSGEVSDDAVISVKEEIEKLGKFKNIYRSTASCTISSHCGPGTLGILFMTK